MSTVVGCSRDIVISSFGVRKAVSPGDNIIEFTPDKTGTINIACSMNMYRGTFQSQTMGILKSGGPGSVGSCCSISRQLWVQAAAVVDAAHEEYNIIIRNKLIRK